MNKHLILAMLAVLFCKGLLAQPPGVSGFRLYDRDYKLTLGPKVGAGMAIGTDTPAFGIESSKGMAYQGGLAFNAHFGRRTRFGFGNGGTGWFGFEVEALYGARSLKVGDANWQMRCVEIPVLAQVYPTAQLGFEAGMTLVRTLGFTPELMPTDNAFLHTGQIGGGDVMLTLGACYKAPFGLLLDARYNLGLSTLAGNLDTKVSTLMVSLGYLFDVVK